ncbi:MAG: hypothetical protein AAF664_05300 [Planctomycetota bacterium]
MGLNTIADDLAALTKGGMELEQLVKANVRDLFAKAAVQTGWMLGARLPLNTLKFLKKSECHSRATSLNA